MSMPSNRIEHISFSTMVADTPQPLGESHDAETLAVNENLNDDSNDNDFMHDSGDENFDSTKDDLSLDDENNIGLEHKVLEQSV